MATLEQCKRITRKGERCKNNAALGSDFCIVHNIAHKRGVGFWLGVVGSIASIIALFIYFFATPPVPTEPSTVIVNQDATKTQITIINRDTVSENSDSKIKAPIEGAEPSPTTENKGAVCQAWTTPIFNPYPVTFDDDNTPFCHDFPMIDVAKDVSNPRFSQSEAEYNAIRKFKVGEQLVVGLYMDNGGIDTSEFTARNVKISTSITEVNGVYNISAIFSGDNIASKTGTVTVDVGPGAYLEVIPKSGFMYDYHGRLILDQQGIELGNRIPFTLGDFDPGFQYSLFLTFKIRVLNKTGV